MKLSTFKPKQSLGQNFLIDTNVAEKIVRSLSLTPADHVLEIGPGQGSLTRLIVAKVAKLIAVELDQRLVSLLADQFETAKNFQLIHADFMQLDIESLAGPDNKLRIVGNVPYNISSQIIFKVIENRNVVKDMTLMLQREVAQRIVAKPDTKDYGILSVISQAYTNVDVLFKVSRHVFSPAPNVDSAIVHWSFDSELSRTIKNEIFFRQIVRKAFAQRRKMLRNSLKDLVKNLQATPVALDRRPEQLAIREWIEFSNVLLNMK